MMWGLSSCTDDFKPIPVPEEPGTTQYSNEVALKWNQFFLDIERFTPGYRPPVSARASAYIGLAAYEAVQPGMADHYNSFSGYFTGLEVPLTEEGLDYHWPTCANAAYARIMSRLFPNAPANQLFSLFALERELNQEFQQEITNEVFVRSQEFGRQVADAVFQWSQTDNQGHEAYLRNTDPNFVPRAGTGQWKPTFPDYSLALLPHWGDVRTFAADASDVAPAPAPYSEEVNSSFYQQALETQRLVNQVKLGRLPEDRWIADFWSDDCPILTFTPSARWIAVANQVVEHERVSLDRAVETYARVGLALNDAGVRCWHEKYRYNVERPIDFIRRVVGEENWNTVMCPDGSGNYFTPPFPAYPSGHATFGAAAAEVLTGLYGLQYAMTDRCHEGRTEFLGKPRSFDNFYAMAEENAYSRLPIGVHFRMDAEAGLSLGAGIGRKVNALPWRK